MAITVADTDVLIDFLRGRDSDFLQSELLNGTLASTVITEFELLSGSAGSARERVGDLLEGLEILPLDRPAVRTAADVRQVLAGRGQPIGTADYLIAGICLVRGAQLLTRNARHFGRVPGLLLVDAS